MRSIFPFSLYTSAVHYEAILFPIYLPEIIIIKSRIANNLISY